MSNQDLFIEDIRKKGVSYVKQLLLIALSDGHLDEVEFQNLVKTANKFNINEDEIMEIKNNMQSVRFAPPKTLKEKFHMMFDLVWMMMVNGIIHEKEQRMCENMAMQLGFAPEMVDDLMGLISANISKGILAEETYSRLEEMF
jgi:hypothetical protein